ncbi:hypothetical protein G4V39_00530 [Thermosulfuriphilus ammonigenes]|uniref:Uncharacterized protein n=1 Tax=Thermosulfuriphilus ammonigenes TaxID=1936021 RepID=A0A6G7PT40_9BACT|nr:hypothetical protein [Thermosulfuriphilus ammonigenes]MBA2849229.1 vacuolar-type H+-ATPase subunit H [Thermosulfuriphilus ammonigenes]QIJ70844.1 hypothetical protein G4V39_00530 [Thermosulfuriphilus ammonigenes]
MDRGIEKIIKTDRLAQEEIKRAREEAEAINRQTREKIKKLLIERDHYLQRLREEELKEVISKAEKQAQEIKKNSQAYVAELKSSWKARKKIILAGIIDQILKV